MLINNDSTITIIQGDTYERYLTIENLSTTQIAGVYFSCKGLNLNKKLELTEDGEYVLSLTSEETKLLPVIRSNYDITIKLIDNKIKTLVYTSTIKVLEKINEVIYD